MLVVMKMMIGSELVLPVCWWAWWVITDENGVDGDDNDDRKSHPPAFWWAQWMMMITMMRMVTIMMTGSELVPPASVSFEVSLGKFPMQVKIWPRQTIVTGPEHGDGYSNDDDDDSYFVLFIYPVYRYFKLQGWLGSTSSLTYTFVRKKCRNIFVCHYAKKTYIFWCVDEHNRGSFFTIPPNKWLSANTH